jgi:cysteine synthase A
LDAFVCGAGTGGSIAGISNYLKRKNNSIDIVLADPEGSGLFNKIRFGVLYTNQ